MSSVLCSKAYPLPSMTLLRLISLPHASTAPFSFLSLSSSTLAAGGKHLGQNCGYIPHLWHSCFVLTPTPTSATPCCRPRQWAATVRVSVLPFMDSLGWEQYSTSDDDYYNYSSTYTSSLATLPYCAGKQDFT
ncbi:hypothetical protein C8F01DRAFT_1156479 [Mycena amicta]|nr:hypothetical protein C8F01DRAFT_1156479 [Mycena amicta]